MARVKEPTGPSAAGLVILQAKRQLGCTLAEMETWTGVPWRTLYNHETGRRRTMRIAGARALAKALSRRGVKVEARDLTGGPQ